MLDNWALAMTGESFATDIMPNIFEQCSTVITKLNQEADSIKKDIAAQYGIPITEKHNSSVAQLIYNYGSFKAVSEFLNEEPRIGIGCGLGKLAVLVCSGYLTLHEGIEIILKSKMQEDCEEQLLVQGMHYKIALTYLPQYICSILSENSFIVRLCDDEIEEYIKLWKSKGICVETVKQQTFAGLQENQLDNEVVKEILEKKVERSFQWPVISNVTGKELVSEQDVKDYLLGEMNSITYWNKVSDYLVRNQIVNVLEVGCSEILSSVIKKNAKYIKMYLANSKFGLEKMKLLCSTLAYSFSGKCLGAAVFTKNQNDNREIYDEQVMKAIKDFKKYSIKMEKKNELFTNEDIEKSVGFLKGVLAAKNVQQGQQDEIMKYVME